MNCPVCHWPHGFHDRIQHDAREVPANLTWKPGELAPWEKEEAAARSADLTDRATVEGNGGIAETLSVLKGPTADDLF